MYQYDGIGFQQISQSTIDITRMDKFVSFDGEQKSKGWLIQNTRTKLLVYQNEIGNEVRKEKYETRKYKIKMESKWNTVEIGLKIQNY